MTHAREAPPDELWILVEGALKQKYNLGFGIDVNSYHKIWDRKDTNPRVVTGPRVVTF